MFIVNTDYYNDEKLEMLGLVRGNYVQTKNALQDIGAGLKTIVGGELRAYTDMMNEARDYATERMIKEAESMGADGIVNVKYVTSSIIQGSAEVLAYGTAVKIVTELC